MRFVFILILSFVWTLPLRAQPAGNTDSNVISFGQASAEILVMRQLEPSLGLFYSNLTYGGNHGSVMSLWKLYVTQTEHGRTLILDHWNDTGNGEANVRRLSEIPLSSLTPAGALTSDTPYKMRILRDGERAIHLGSPAREALTLLIETHGKSTTFTHNTPENPYLEMTQGFKFTLKENAFVRSILVLQKAVSEFAQPSQVTAMQFINGDYEVEFGAPALSAHRDLKTPNQCRHLFTL